MTETIVQIQRTASLLVPEIILLATVCVLFLCGPLLVSAAGEAAPGLRHRWGVLTLLALAIATIVAWSASTNPSTAMVEPAAQQASAAATSSSQEGALFRIDRLSDYTRSLSLAAGMLLALVLWSQTDDDHAAEAFACLLSIVTGTNLVAESSDLVSLFLALELVSIPTYVILYLTRRDRVGREASIKYFLLSIFSSGLVLYGMAWLYGVTGTTNLAAIGDVLESRAALPGDNLLPIAFALLMAGLGFRIAAVPFHFYAPDVFQGTTAANAALLSFIPKVVGFVALGRLLPLTGATTSLGSWLPDDMAQPLLALLAVVTMFVGNLMALRQKQLYRLMAYSSVAHAGYMLVGLAAGNVGTIGGTDALLFYLAAYGLMTIGVFALLAHGALRLETEEHQKHQTLRTSDDLRGLSQTCPSVALLLAVCLFSLTGLPPTAGFLGKLSLFLAAWSSGSNIGRWLAVIMALNAAIAAWYYLRLIAVMFLDSAAVTPVASRLPSRRGGWSAWLAGAICTAATVGIFLSPQWLWDSLP